MPFLALASYSHPALDDFAIGNALRTTTVGCYVWNTYFTYSGRFSASLFSCIHLGMGDSVAWYPYLITIFIGVFALSLYGAAAALIPKDCTPAGRLVAGSMVLIAGFSAFPWPAEGLFWLTGVVAYLIPLIFTCWLVALMASIYFAPVGSPQRLKWIVCILLGFLIPGFSEVTALITLLVVGAHLYFSSISHAYKNGYWLMAALVFGSIFTLAAPGNFVRLQAEGEKIQMARSVWLAAGTTVYLLLNWAGNGLLLVLTIIMLPLSQAVARSPRANLLNRVTTRKYLWPGLLFTGLFMAVLFCYLERFPGWRTCFDLSFRDASVFSGPA
ncbi:hypothetical protein BEN47_19700 [Hymenobacter lapidarius]|uniref:Glycosyltransferase RgtA/B/C/D-like domain-containing protein n=1 Tax=Hymenobacter lapidarius TaxID=1908237 RepID=A0A1G1TF07_9BACT|nr:hypothetical protein BEN47_19700 [Hymenobacter lapidarius]